MEAKILVVFGTRPEVIKLAPVVRQLARSRRLRPVVCATAQHRELLDQMLRVFALRPDFDLDIMGRRQSLAEITRRVLDGVSAVVRQVRPAWMLVQGDTTTTFAAALAAFYARVPVAHVEAGLRTHDKGHPFPEEINRCLTTQLADLHFAPTEKARRNLLREGVPDGRIQVTGNTVVDALRWVGRSLHGAGTRLDGLGGIRWQRDFPVLVTAHRRENWADMERLCEALRGITRLSPRVHVILPLHPNPAVGEVFSARLKGADRIHLLPALPYTGFLGLMKQCRAVVTDSGGVQEEVASLGKPVVVLRRTTERPEILQAGYGVLAGTDPEKIVTAVKAALQRKTTGRALNPFGDGHAAERIVRRLEQVAAGGSAL
jgi:UDP-N-acetylglucosamine 2-epimerase (non-hydrolysing)